MAKSLVTDAGTIFIPGAYSQYKVASNPSGLATTGILMLVGEADAGPDHTLESDLELNAFTPDQLGEVIAKYKSGPVVDAFRAACAPANDPDITGSFSSAIIVKTNVSAKASGTLPKVGGGTYATIADRSYGKGGNGIAYQVKSAQAEVLPTTGSFTYIPPVNATNWYVKVNGVATTAAVITANAGTGSTTLPTAFQSLADGLAGVDATGGTVRNPLNAGPATIALQANPGGAGVKVIELTHSTSWATSPVAGDTLMIPVGSVIAGTGNANVGAYVITSVTTTTLLATKLSDVGIVGASPSVVTNPVTVTSVAVSVIPADDAQAYAPITISMAAGSSIEGYGKSLEIAELSGTQLLSSLLYQLGSTTAVTWISKSSAPKLLTGTERQVTLNTNKNSESISESFTVGGDIALKIGYTGVSASDSATVTITDSALTTTVTGGTGANLSLTLKDYSSIQALADYIASQTGYTCTVGTAALGQLPVSALDNVSGVGIVATHANSPGRIKIDAYRFFTAVSEGSTLVQIGVPAAQAGSGLPDVMAAQTFLTGGTKGGTSDSQVSAAITALESVRGNFLVPLFSRDASADITDGLTDVLSTYTIAAVHASAKSHVLSMSTLKRRRNRQAFLSMADAFATVKETAANIASFRCSMACEDFKQVGSSGSVQQFLPWMGATLAAAMQAAGFYRNIEFKGINTSGVLVRAGDWNPKNDGNVEQALQAGLLVARTALTGGYVWVSDQTTYGKDSNFVFNSIQAVYAADTVSLTMAQRMETAFVGQSVADISAPVARAFAEGVLVDMLRLKLIAPSDDNAPNGYKNLSIKIRGNTMLVSVEIKLATAIDFIKIDFLVSPVEQSA